MNACSEPLQTSGFSTVISGSLSVKILWKLSRKWQHPINKCSTLTCVTLTGAHILRLMSKVLGNGFSKMIPALYHKPEKPSLGRLVTSNTKLLKIYSYRTYLLYRMYLFKMFIRFMLSIFLGFSLLRKTQHLFLSPISSSMATDQWKGKKIYSFVQIIFPKDQIWY